MSTQVQITPLKITTPIGSARYPHLTTPDTKFNVDGEYRVELILPAGTESDEFEEICSAYRDKCVAEYRKLGGGKALKVSAHFPMTRNEDGTLSIKAKMKAKVTTKTGRSWEQRPMMFDTKGTPVTGDLRIGSGSRMRLSLEMTPFNSPAIGGAGLSARLRGVQLIEIRESAGQTATDFGFGAAETGYVTETFSDFEDDAQSATETPKAAPKQRSKVDF